MQKGNIVTYEDPTQNYQVQAIAGNYAEIIKIDKHTGELIVDDTITTHKTNLKIKY